MLKLGRALAICGAGCPVVLPSEVFPGALIHHGLNREDVALLHEAYGFVGAIVRNRRRLMENPSDSVASVRAHHRVAVRLNRVCDDVADLAVHFIGRTVRYRVHQALVSLLDEGATGLGHIADQISLIQVAVVPIVIRSHV